MQTIAGQRVFMRLLENMKTEIYGFFCEQIQLRKKLDLMNILPESYAKYCLFENLTDDIDNNI